VRPLLKRPADAGLVYAAFGPAGLATLGRGVGRQPDEREGTMDAWVWIVIAVAAVVVIGVLILSARKARQRRLESKRGEARELRTQAQVTAERAEHRAATADELAERARVERGEAEAAARRANEVDPDVED